MDASFQYKIERILELVQYSEELLRKADDIKERSRLESEALASIVWKSKKHCESAEKLFTVLATTAPVAAHHGPDAV